MKYLPIALLLCLLGVGMAEEEYYRYEGYGDEGYGDEGYGEEEAVPDERYYTGSPDGTTEPKPIRRIFGVDKWDINDAVDEIEDEEGTRYVWVDGVVEAVEENVIPELCYLTPDNITIYNSFLLDHTCLVEFESVSPQCRGFRCDLAHYFLDHGAQIFMDFMNAPTVKDGMEVVHRELSNAFEKLDMCTCGREFFKAAFKCAPFYHSNALYAASGHDEDFMFGYGKALRNVDLKSASKFWDRMMSGVCAESSSGICLNSIFKGFEEFADLVENTIEQYEDYDDGDRKYQKSLEKRCDNVFASIRAWTRDDREMWEYDYDEEGWTMLFNKTSAVTKAFYCNKKCKKDDSRVAMYPCCLRRMLEDDKMWDNVVRVIESIYRVIPAMNSDFEWDGFYELDSYFYRYEYSQEELDEIMVWTLPESIRDSFMQTVHAARYCEGKVVRCSK